MKMWSELLAILAPSMGRGILGWVENSFKDGIITPFEYTQLGQTIIRIGTLTLLAYFGIMPLLGANADLLVTSIGVAGFDFIASKVKSVIKKKK